MTAAPQSTPDLGVLDCMGVPGGDARYDCCGICGGDGTSCPQLCTEIDNRKVKQKIRISLKSLTVDTLNRVNRELQCRKNNPAAIKRRKETTAIRLQVRHLLGVIEDHTRLCDTSFCTKTSFQELNREINANLQRLVVINKNSQRAGIQACCRGRSCSGSGTKGKNWRVVLSNAVDQLPEIKCD